MLLQEEVLHISVYIYVSREQMVQDVQRKDVLKYYFVYHVVKLLMLLYIFLRKIIKILQINFQDLYLIILANNLLKLRCENI